MWPTTDTWTASSQATSGAATASSSRCGRPARLPAHANSPDAAALCHKARLRVEGGVEPVISAVDGLDAALEEALTTLEDIGTALLCGPVADYLGVPGAFFRGLLDGPPAAKENSSEDSARRLRHSLLRACRYVAGVRGVGGTDVLCDEHTDVGFLTLDVHAERPGLQVRRLADDEWLHVETEGTPGPRTMAVMVGDTLARLTGDHLAATPHRVSAPADGERIGLPFLLRGRQDAVLDTTDAIAAGRAAGKDVRVVHMQTTAIKELPALDAAHSILKNWILKAKTGRDSPQ